MKRISLVLIIILAVTQVFSQITIKGTVKSVTGKPILKTDVYIVSINETRVGHRVYPFSTLGRIAADENGRFEIERTGNDPFALQFTGVHHQPFRVLIFPPGQRRVTIDVKLATHHWKKNFSYKIVGSFNNYSQLTGIEMKTVDSIHYSAQLSNIKTDTFYYQITELSKDHMVSGISEKYNPMLSTSFAHEGYSSVGIAQNGTAEIKLNYNDLPYSNEKAFFASDDSTIEKCQEIYHAMNDRFEQSLSAYFALTEAGKTPDSTFVSYTLDKGKVAALEHSISKETNLNLKQMLLLSYLDLAGYAIEGNGKQMDKISLKYVEMIFTEIPPGSPLWAIAPKFISTLGMVAISEEALEKYLQRIYTESAFDKVKSRSLFVLLELRNKAKKEFNDLFQTLIEEFPKSSDASIAKKLYSIGPNPKIGKKVAPFSIAPVSGNGLNYTSESMRGKYLLVDFWATWCVPCIREIPGLEKAYSQFADKGLEIWSISFDKEKETVKKFFEKRGKIFLWPNGIDQMGFSGILAKTYEIDAIPFIFLIGPDGSILEMNESLRGEKLTETLKKYLK